MKRFFKLTLIIGITMIALAISNIAYADDDFDILTPTDLPTESTSTTAPTTTTTTPSTSTTLEIPKTTTTTVKITKTTKTVQHLQRRTLSEIYIRKIPEEDVSDRKEKQK